MLSARSRPSVVTMRRTTAFRLLSAVLTALLATLLVAGSATAGTLTDEGGTWVFRAAPGERNVIHVGPNRWDDEDLMVFHDDGLPFALPAGCTRGPLGATDPTYAYCEYGDVRVEAGDGDDWVFVSEDLPANLRVSADGGPGNDRMSGPIRGVAVTFTGGEGNDELNGGYQDDVLDGGPGNDVLDGKKGDDQVLGGEGDDVLRGDDLFVGSDLIDGGPGYDTINRDWIQTDRSPGLTISLDGLANDGHPNERDNVVNVERIDVTQPATLIAGGTPVHLRIINTDSGSSKLVGSDGADTLVSYDYADEIDGKGGDDTIEGGNGDDRIVGGPGRDTINAEAGPNSCNFLVCRGLFGNDWVDVRDGEKDTVTCGPGTDTVIADAIDEIAADCEKVDRGTVPGPDPGDRDRDGGTPAVNRCVVPKVKAGTKPAAAKRALTRKGCTAKTKQVRSAKVRKGRVVKLSQKAGRRLKHKATVVVYVSRGRR
jgi:Ca2+-binding RTX toxin-like protein